MAVHIHTIQFPRNITAASLVRLQFLKNIQKPPACYTSHGKSPSIENTSNFAIFLNGPELFMKHAGNCKLKHRKLCWHYWSLNYIGSCTYLEQIFFMRLQLYNKQHFVRNMIRCVVCEVLGVEEHNAEMEVAWPWDKKFQRQTVLWAKWWMCLCS